MRHAGTRNELLGSNIDSLNNHPNKLSAWFEPGFMQLYQRSYHPWEFFYVVIGRVFQDSVGNIEAYLGIACY